MTVEPITWIAPPATGDEPLRIKAASISRLHTYEACPRHAALAFLVKVPEPVRSGGESPLDRGTRHHALIEGYIKGELPELSPEIQYHRKLIDELRERWATKPETIRGEQMWCFASDWTPVRDDEYDRIWLRVKTDVFFLIDNTDAEVLDWKTGKKYGNEIKHADQSLLYCAAALMRYGTLESVTARMLYTDHNEQSELHLTPETLRRYLPKLNQRLVRMTEVTSFPPKPSTQACRFCPYKTGQIDKQTKGTGHCDQNPV